MRAGSRDDAVLSGQGGGRKPSSLSTAKQFLREEWLWNPKRGTGLVCPCDQRVLPGEGGQGTGAGVDTSPAPPWPWEEAVLPSSFKTPRACFICELTDILKIRSHTLAIKKSPLNTSF